MNKTSSNPLVDATLDLFGLAPGEIQSFEVHPIKSGYSQIEITLSPRPTQCPCCGDDHPHICNYTLKRISHSAIHGLKTDILYHRRRYRCPTCKKTWSEEDPFTFKKKRISSAITIQVLEDLKNPTETYASIGHRHGISAATVQNIFDQHVYFPHKRKLPQFLIVDEVYAFKNEISGYVCVLMDGITEIPVDLLPNRRKNDLKNFAELYSREERKKVKYCCSDMYQPYQDFFKTYFPNAVRAVDRFHVVQEFDRRMTKVRIAIMKQNYQGSDHYYLLKHWNHLLGIRPGTRDEKTGQNIFDPAAPKEFNQHFSCYLNKYDLRQRLLAVSQDLEECYRYKNELSDFFRIKTRSEAAKKIDKFIEKLKESELIEMQEFARTMEHWHDEILNSFIVYQTVDEVDPGSGKVIHKKKRLNSGIMENKNGIIKKLKRNANGFANWERFRNRVLYVLDKDSTYSLEPLDIRAIHKADPRE